MGTAQATYGRAGAVIAALLLVLALPACTHQTAQCPLAAHQAVRVTELFFGRDIHGRAPLSDAEWSEFVSSVIAKEFPAGFTLLDGEGGWRDPASGNSIRERTNIVLLAGSGDDLSARIGRVIEIYRTSYHQTSVGMLVYDACGSFGN